MGNGSVLSSVSIPVDQLERDCKLLHLLLEFSFVHVEHRSRNVIIAELIIGIGRYKSKVERRIATRMVGSRNCTSVRRVDGGGVVVTATSRESWGFVDSMVAHREGM